jgi:hypothetical protein
LAKLKTQSDAKRWNYTSELPLVNSSSQRRIQYRVPSNPDFSSLTLAAPTLSGAWQRNAAIVVSVSSIAILLLSYLAVAAPGRWLDAPPILQWKAREFSASRGTAQHTSAGLVVTAPDATRTAVIALNTSFRARDYLEIAWDAMGIPDNAELSLLWYSDINSSRVFRHPLTLESGRIAPVNLAQDPGWLGRIGGVALVIQGDFPEPIVLRGAVARPMSAVQVFSDRMREWLAFQPWTGASINGVTASPESVALPLPLALAAIAGLACLFYAGLVWLKLRALGPSLGVGIAGILIAAWAIDDARWQWNLVRQAISTVEQYGGKSWDARHLAAEDGSLFAFIDKVRDTLPPPPARVFIAADLAYFRARGAYHLYPYNVFYDPSSTALPAPGLIRAGDYLVVYQRRGVQYDASAQRVRWDGQAPVSAELLLVEPGSALFKIR